MLVGTFDATALSEAFKAISLGALKTRNRENPEAVKISLSCEEIAAGSFAIIEWEPVNFNNGDPFSSFNGSEAIRMSLAAKIVEAHGGTAEQKDHSLRVCLPLNSTANAN